MKYLRELAAIIKQNHNLHAYIEDRGVVVQWMDRGLHKSQLVSFDELELSKVNPFIARIEEFNAKL